MLRRGGRREEGRERREGRGGRGEEGGEKREGRRGRGEEGGDQEGLQYSLSLMLVRLLIPSSRVFLSSSLRFSSHRPSISFITTYINAGGQQHAPLPTRTQPPPLNPPYPPSSPQPSLLPQSFCISLYYIF